MLISDLIVLGSMLAESVLEKCFVYLGKNAGVPEVVNEIFNSTYLTGTFNITFSMVLKRKKL